jgi:ribonuclease J
VKPGDGELLFLPLGGSGEIGMNMTLYGHAGQWLIVDLGITFAGEDFPDFDVLMPDPAFIEQQRDAIAGIVLTHGHEDHVGALPYLWPRLRCPVYATRFTAAMVARKFARAGINGVPVIERQVGERFPVGPFTVEYIGMTHSIPEPNMVLLQCAAGETLHTGDWKLDPAPVVGASFDRDRLLALRHAPLRAVVCDSTNAVVPGRTGSEGDLLHAIERAAQSAGGRVLVTTFASNVARLVTLARVAQRLGRRFGVVGRALEQMLALARGVGLWPEELPPVVDAAHIGYLPRDEVFAVCTGSQGEPRSALARLAAGSHRDLLLEAGDRVLFSSRMIPGNERHVSALQQRLAAAGIRIVTADEAPIHVSGHPAQDDLRQLYDWIRPRSVIPVHGTPRHLEANARLATACGAGAVHVPRNGEICRLDPACPRVVGEVANGRLALTASGELEPVPADILARMRAGAN